MEAVSCAAWSPAADSLVKAFTASAAGSVNCTSVAVLSSSVCGIRVFPARLPEAAATHAARSVARATIWYLGWMQARVEPPLVSIIAKREGWWTRHYM